jgi:hypothetical protein
MGSRCRFHQSAGVALAISLWPVASSAQSHHPPSHIGQGGENDTMLLMEQAREMGSGTALIPANSPMRMWWLSAADWLVMVHGDATLGLNHQSGPRGTTSWAAENWAMAMGMRRLGPGRLDLRGMFSLEPLTLPPGGTPELFQTGETYQNKPLVDRQHPHDLFGELAVRYTWFLADRVGVFGYVGLVGEPALGPPAFLHRPSALDNHWAPLGHHLQDSTHIVFGVATAGIRSGPLQVEGSVFNGREPDENRFDVEFAPWRSYAVRASWAPSPRWVGQVSYGHLVNPEPLSPGDVNRLTASISHNQPFPGGNWAVTALWGRNHDFHEPDGAVLDGYLLESQLTVGEANHLYGRYEAVDRTGLLGRDEKPIRGVGALTLGYARDLNAWAWLDLAAAADATVYAVPPALASTYGEHPWSFRIYLRGRPPLKSHPTMP